MKTAIKRILLMLLMVMMIVAFVPDLGGVGKAYADTIIDNINIVIDFDSFTNFAVGKTAGDAYNQLFGSDCVISTDTVGTYNSLSANSLTYKVEGGWNHCDLDDVISIDNEYAIYVDAFALKEGYEFSLKF